MSINGLMYRNFRLYSFMLALLIFMDFFFLLFSRCTTAACSYYTCEVNFHLDSQL